MRDGVDEERELSTAYRTTRRVRRPEGQGLNDLYVRFFRMAERRIAEKTGQGVVCFISNYSWLDSLSCPGMRERYLDAFDVIRIDNLNGDKYRTGKVAPDGSPDPSIFSTPDDPIGIQVGTAIATLVRKQEHAPAPDVQFRNLWGRDKPEALTETAEVEPHALYDAIEPILPLGLPFAPVAVSPDWFDWPALPELLPTSFPGVKTSRDAFLVDVDLERLRTRMAEYFDQDLSHAEIARRYPSVMRRRQRFDATGVREALLKRGGPTESGFVRYAYRPFDTRWLYWERDTKLLDEKRAEYRPHVFAGNLWLESREREAKDDFSRGAVTRNLADNFGNGLSSFLGFLSEDTLGPDTSRACRPNLSPAARRYLDRLNLTVEDIFHHVLAVLHDPAYRQANAGALRMEWPRIPLPHWPELSARTGAVENDVAAMAEAADTLAASIARGRELAALLDPETPVPGVTTGQLRPEIAAIAVPATTHGHNMFGDDFGLTAGWGHFGSGQAVMPGQGQAVERAYTGSESSALGTALDTVGETTYDIHLNDHAYWRNVPTDVWNYRLGGYQVLKKWLSYRERKVLGRALTVEEVGYFSEVARRIGAILIPSSQHET